MIQTISFPEDFAISKIMFCKEINIDKLSDPRIIPLFGPNGIGKSTLIRAIGTTLEVDQKVSAYKKDGTIDTFKDYLMKEWKRKGCVINRDDKPLKVLTYINSESNCRYRDMTGGRFDPYTVYNRLLANNLSEGQSIIYSVFDLFEILKPGKEFSVLIENGELLVLIDEMDSGLSIDNLDMLMRKIKYILRKRDDVQFVFSFNNPRVLKHFPEVISLYDGNPLVLHSDEDMLNEIRKNKKDFNKKRKKSDGRPKSY